MLKLGWSARDITPDGPVLLHGQHHVRVSTHVNDPLFVTALAIEGEGDAAQAVLVSADLCWWGKETVAEIRRRAAEQIDGLDPMAIIPGATHTHTGPGTREGFYRDPDAEFIRPADCEAYIIERTVEAVAEAWNGRQPGALGRAFTHAVVGHNRRAVFTCGHARMYGNTSRDDFDFIEGYEDHSLDLLFTRDGDGKLTGVLVNVPCPSQVTESALYVFADFWYETREAIRAKLGDDLFILPQCAAAGDQSPHFLVYKREEARMRELRGLTEREEIARRIADAVADAAELIGDGFEADMVVKHTVETLPLTARRVTDEEAAQARADEAEWEAVDPDHPKKGARRQAMLRRARGVQAKHAAQKDDSTHPTEVHALRLGDVAMVTNPFELYLDYGICMKARSPAEQTFVAQLVADRGAYLPTQRAMATGHYGAGAADNLVGPEGGRELVERTLAMIEELWA